jgi:hypothetical protein
MQGLVSLDLTGSNDIEKDALASIVRDLKTYAIEKNQACTCLVGHERMTEDLRALLVATNNLCDTLPALDTEQMCEEIAFCL